MQATKETQVETEDEPEKATKVGFVNMQKSASGPEPDILLDSGSTISLFRDKEFLEKTWDSKTRLLMETNAGNKIIMKQGEIAGFGDVWFDEEAVSNLLGLNDVVSRGHRVTYDSDTADQFVLHVRDKDKVVQREILFPVSERGLYVKEKEIEMDARRMRKDDSKKGKVPALILKQRKKM